MTATQSVSDNRIDLIERSSPSLEQPQRSLRYRAQSSKF
jgi:hypothetical protein